MGGNKRRKKKNSKKQEHLTPPPPPSQQPTAHHFSSKVQQQQLPLAFPQNLPVPPKEFLRDEEPYQKSFQAALSTSFLGLVVDSPTVVASHANKEAGGTKQKQKQRKRTPAVSPPLCETLQDMASAGIYQTDVTQPFGLGSKCAKTYVTRCLVGDHGTTYKYLGLRMFAYRWDQMEGEEKVASSSSSNSNGNSNSNNSLCHEIGAFKDRVLAPRTKTHLNELQTLRKTTMSSINDRSEANYNICLINRMDSSTAKDYKLEPTLEQESIAVAWHADSSLKHFSNIAVYQLILPTTCERSTTTNSTDKDDDSNLGKGWLLAVRTTPNAEGPQISAEHTPDPTIPQLAIQLPSGSAYYMLDDFNHHHQHAVLYDNNNSKDGGDTTKRTEETPPPPPAPTIRYSATYRLLRPSHTVSEVLLQCQRASKSFHKRGVKLWRSEQLLLTHVESEWLRQFYIQGQHHYDNLWCGNWDDPLLGLWRHWQQLEDRTRQTLELLQLAAQGKCCASSAIAGSGKDGPPPSKVERKKRDKQQKAHATIQALLERGDANPQQHTPNNNSTNNALDSVYTPIAELLRERAGLRAQWQKREKDHVFTTMQPQFRPLPWPVQHNSQPQPANNKQRGGDSFMAVSSMPGSPEVLQALASQLILFGKAYDSGLEEDLPLKPQLFMSPSNSTSNSGRLRGEDDASSSSVLPETKQQQQYKPKSQKGKRNKNKRGGGASSENTADGTKKKKKRF